MPVACRHTAPHRLTASLLFPGTFSAATAPHRPTRAVRHCVAQRQLLADGNRSTSLDDEAGQAGSASVAAEGVVARRASSHGSLRVGVKWSSSEPGTGSSSGVSGSRPRQSRASQAVTAANQGHIGDRRQARRARPNGQVGDRLGGEGVFLAAVDAAHHRSAGRHRSLDVGVALATGSQLQALGLGASRGRIQHSGARLDLRPLQTRSRRLRVYGD